ncbi:hypothetical protein [Corallococcus sp. CA049B]|uniref:hypothetical protein n=1 Tax=Corallococcus sp. CA049B TaxID=2316730 RepID=UPI0011C44B86|nr:hypothetical protein [Corallococcus sp. CA049B]
MTTILAEEIGVGVAVHLARTFLDVVHVADVAPLLQAGDLAFTTPPVSPMSPEARPDYLGVLKSGECILFEAKGAVGTAGRLKKPLEKAEIQVDNVQFVKHSPRTVNGQPCGDRIVMGTHFCVDGAHAKSETTTILIDPPGRGRVGDDFPPSDLPLRVAYAKAFNFGERPLVADALVRRVDLSGVFGAPEFEVNGLSVRAVGPFLWGGVLVIDARLAAILEQGARGNLSAAVAERTNRLQEELSTLEETPYFVMLNNGIGVLLDG